MTHGKAMRIGFLAAAFWLPAAAYAQTAAPPDSDLAAEVSQLLQWVDEGLGHAADASQTDLPPPPALGEGPIGQAIDWFLGDGEAQSGSTGAADVAAPQSQPLPVAAATPATVAVDAMGAPDDEPFILTAQPRPVAAARSQGLLLPVATP